MPDQHQLAPNEHQLALRAAGQVRTNFAVIKDDLELVLQQINRLPTASDLWRIAMLIALIGGVLCIVGSHRF